MEQTRVVKHPGGPLLVLAGPGTGKTRVVTQRIARLVRRGVSPRAIRAITFTRRAAGELRERLAALLGPEAEAIEAQTFHSFGLALLRDFTAAADLAPDFAILDEAARAEAFEAAAKEAGVAPSAKVSAAIGRAKATLLDPGDCADPDVAAVYAAYQRALAVRGAIDLDDIAVRAVRLLETSAEALASARERRHLFVDEYQDVNPAQERLVLLLAPPGPEAELCVVGDPDQAIYGFRGSDPACVDRFVTHYRDATVVALRTNYRCPASVVRAATRIIERAPGRARRALEPLTSASSPIERFRFANEAEEAHFIAREIERTIGGTSLGSIDAGRADGGNDAELAFHDVAVLLRTSAQVAAIGLALDREGIPYQRVGDDAPTSRPAAVELLARLRALVDSSVMSADAARAEALDAAPVADRIAGLVADDDDDERRAAAELLATLAVPFGRDVAAFLDAVPSWQAGDVSLAAQKVALLTLHASKGLEFPLVFIAGCEDGLLPLHLPGRHEDDREEERRLFYVGMTRAKHRLVLTEARERKVRGSVVARASSPFLDDLPPDLVAPPRVSVARPRPAKQLSLL